METLNPTFPSPDLPDYFFWPMANRQYLSAIDLTNIENCNELSGQQGLFDGSGKTDTFIYKTGDWCLKTSLRNHFPNIEKGHEALINLSKKKAALGELLPPKTTLTLQPERGNSAWLWTITPWCKTLRSLMSEATNTHNEVLLAAALQAFARVSVESLLITLQKGVSLDIHPSNFALTNYLAENKIHHINYEKVVYLDDDIVETTECLTVGYALLKRIDEYEKWQKALDIYFLTLEDTILSKISQQDVKKLRLLEAFQNLPLRTHLAQHFATHFISIIKQCD
jgi:hypothetical protein